MRVDPKNADIVYAANTSTYKSIDGGNTFTAIKGAPGGDDYHTIWINPANPEIILIAADQGATITVNGGETWSSWYNQPTAQMFHVAADNRFPYWLYGGQQESGSAGVASAAATTAQITFRDWHTVGVEEYGYAAPDPLHPGIIFGGKVTRYDERTGDVQNVGPIVVRDGKYRFVRTAPILFSPADPHVLFFATQCCSRRLTAARSWTTISPDLSRQHAEHPATLGVYAADAANARQRGVIYAIAPSPRDVNVIWAGTDDGADPCDARWRRHLGRRDAPGAAAVEQGHADRRLALRYRHGLCCRSSRFRVDDLHAATSTAPTTAGKPGQPIMRGLADKRGGQRRPGGSTDARTVIRRHRA